MKRIVALAALAAFALTAPAVAGHNVPIIITMQTAAADRTWVTVYRSELSDMKREIVASGWITTRTSLITHQYNGYMYYVRGQVHHGEKIVADTTAQFDPKHHNMMTLVESNGKFYWQVH